MFLNRLFIKRSRDYIVNCCVALSKRLKATDVHPSTFCGRSHTCGELSHEDTGRRVTLCGWVQYVRMDRFLLVRDCHGLTQVNLEHPRHQDLVKDMTYESVVRVDGVVQERPPGQENKDMATGGVEVIASDVQVLNNCTPRLPFSVRDFHKVNELSRMQYRYLDLRCSHMQRNLRLRSAVVSKMRHFLCDKHGFVDIETPTLFRKTPGGAREFVVPTRVEGEFYALPQSPQQFKQLLMVGGVDRYMQIARCYRDESGRQDRQPEFTQVDLEMSFVTQDDIKALTEQLIAYSWPQDVGMVTAPFPRISYSDAMTQFGSDKPDTRFEMKIENITGLVGESPLPVLHSALSSGGSAYAMNFKQAGKLFTRRNLEDLKTKSKEWQTKFQVWQGTAKIQDGAVWPEFWRENLGRDVTEELNRQLHIEEGDLVLLSCGQNYNPCEVLGKLRLEIADVLEGKGYTVRDKDAFNFLWVEDFPLFLPTEEGEGVESAHHPFTAPHPDDVHLVYTNPLKARSEHYDLVLNGNEIGGGSIRIHDSQLQRHVLQHVLKEECDQLEHLLRALEHGCPPHGGIALGLDRLLAIACGANSIRDVIAFPKSHEGRDLMAGAPSQISDTDKAHYHLS